MQRDLIQRKSQSRRDTNVEAHELCCSYLIKGEKKGTNVPGQRKQVVNVSEMVMNLSHERKVIVASKC